MLSGEVYKDASRILLRTLQKKKLGATTRSINYGEIEQQEETKRANGANYCTSDEVC